MADRADFAADVGPGFDAPNFEALNFEALSFDCYGTLIDWEAGIAAVLGPWAQARGLDITDEALLTAYSGHEARAEAGHPGDLYPLILARSFRDLGRELGAEVTDEDAERLGRSVPDWPAFDDSHDALAALAGRYQLIILSNVDRDSFAASNRRLGVTFTSVLTAQDIGSYKPSPVTSRPCSPGRNGSGSPTAGCCTSPRACSTITFRRSARACGRSGSTAATTGPAGAPPRLRTRASPRTGSSRPCAPSPPPPSLADRALADRAPATGPWPTRAPLADRAPADRAPG